MWRWLRFPIALVAAVLVVILAGTAWLLSGQRYQMLLTEHLSQLLGAEVHVAGSRLSMAGGLGIEFAGITIQLPSEKTPALTAERFDMLLDLKALIRGRLLFNEVKASRPYIRIADNPKQGIVHLFSLLAATEKTVTAHTETPGGLTPTLAVRHVAIYDGGVEYLWKTKDKGASFILSQLDLTLAHPNETGVVVRGQALIGTKGELGKVTIHAIAPTWSTQADQQQVVWQGSVGLQAVVFHQLGLALGKEWTVGTFSGNLKYEGKIAGPIRIEGTVDARNVHVDALTFPKVEGTIAQLQWTDSSSQKPAQTWRERLRGVTAEVKITQILGGPKDDPRQISLSQGTILLRDGTLALRGLSGDYGKKSHLRTGKVTFPTFASTAGGEFAALFEADMNLQEDLRELTTMLTKLGVVNIPSLPQSLYGNATLVISLYSPRFPTALTVDGELTLDQLAFRLPLGKAAITDGSGKLHITNRLVETQGTEAVSFKLGESTVQITGQIVDYTSPQRAVDLTVKGNLALADLPELLKGIVRVNGSTTKSEVEAIDQAVKDPAGRAQMQLTLQTSVPSRALTYEGTVTFYQAEVTLPKVNLLLHGVEGAVQVNNQTLSTEGLSFDIAGAPVQVSGTLHDYQTSLRNGEGRITFTGVSDATVAPLLPLKLLGTHGGQIDGKVEVTLSQGGELHTSGELILNNIQLYPLPRVFRPLGITQGQLTWQPGQSVSLTIVQGMSQGGGFTGSGRIHSLSPVNLELALDFVDLDLGAVFNLESPKVEDQRPKNETVQVHATLKADRFQYKTFAAEQVRASCYWHGRQADIQIAESKTVGGILTGEATLWPDHNGLYVVPHVTGADVSRLLAMLNTPSDKITGTLEGKGRLYFPDWHTWSNLAQARAHVSLALADGVTQQIPILVRLWSAVSLQELLSFQLPSLPNDGLAFSSLAGDFLLGDGIAVTSNLNLTGNSVRLAATGEIDLAQHTLDLKTSLMPLHGITSSVAKVPLAGELLARGAEILTTLPFRVHGPYSDPTITPLVVDLGLR